MIPYLIVFILTPFLTYIIELKLSKNKKKSAFFLMIILVLISSIIAGIRDISVGVDGKVYVEPLLNKAQTMPLNSFLQSTITETGYSIFIYIVSHIYNNVNFAFFMIELIISSLFMISAYRMRSKLNMTIFMTIFSLFCFPNSLNIMRQCMGIAFVVLAITYFFEQKNTKAFILTLIGILFHSSMILFLAIYFLYYINNKIKGKYIKFIIFIIILFLGLLLSINFVKVMTFLIYDIKILPEKFGIYLGRINDFKINYLVYILKLILLLLSVMICINKKNIKLFNFNQTMVESIGIGFVMACSMIFVGQLGEIYRMSYTFTLIGSVFAIPQILNCFKKSKLNLMVYLMTYMIFLFEFIRVYVIGGSAQIYPFIINF